MQDNALGLNVHIEDVSEAIAAVALQGPTSRELLKELAAADLDSLKYFRLLRTRLAAIPATISRTGYTGDLGYEIWVDPQHAGRLWDALVEAGSAYRVRAAGNLALDMARIEAGLLLINVDFVSSKKAMFDLQKSSPLELGLGWTVKLEKKYFVGQAALRREKARGPAWQTVGLELDLPALEALYREFGLPLTLPGYAWNDAVPVYDPSGTIQIGKATSGTWSPILKKYVALARIRPRYAEPGTQVNLEVTVEAHRRPARATVVRTPFFDPPRKRA
jgi:aminomethyltransferase